jgi:hypothetical protein
MKLNSVSVLLYANHFSRSLGIILVTFLVFFLLEKNAFASAQPIFGLNIGMVKPTFTAAAYSDGAFYDFYDKHYREARDGKNITEDLEMLTAKVPARFAYQIHPELFEMLPLHIEQTFPRFNISLINDAEVHDGKIFKVNDNGIMTNAYDIIMIGHQEYVTHEEYSNLKTFVSNGGTLIVLTGNVFYAEVRYNRDNNLVTLVKGHDWGFDGKSAWRDTAERWKDETRQWLGSNFYPIYYYSERYHKLGNNPFNFTGTGGGEEQYYDVTNRNIEPILDYKSSDFKYPIATYKLNYDKGRVIVIGLPSEDIISDPCSTSCQKFIKFFDDLLSDYAM